MTLLQKFPKANNNNVHPAKQIYTRDTKIRENLSAEK